MIKSNWNVAESFYKFDKPLVLSGDFTMEFAVIPTSTCTYNSLVSSAGHNLSVRMSDIPKSKQPSLGQKVEFTVNQTDNKTVKIATYQMIVKTKSKQPRTVAIKRTIFF